MVIAVSRYEKITLAVNNNVAKTALIAVILLGTPTVLIIINDQVSACCGCIHRPIGWVCRQPDFMLALIAGAFVGIFIIYAAKKTTAPPVIGSR